MMPDCLIPAAGFSSRMGVWKPALMWGDRSLIETVVDAALTAGCRVIVIGGYRFRRLKALLSGRPGVSVVRARRWRRGMSFTLRRGVREVATDRFFITPVDMPLIGASVYRELDAEFSQGSGGTPTALRPVWQGVPGHPVLISSRLIPELLVPGPSSGGFRELLDRGGSILGREWNDEGVVIDIDTPQEYARLRPGPEGPRSGDKKRSR